VLKIGCFRKDCCFWLNHIDIMPAPAVDWSEMRRSSQNAIAFRSCGEYSRKLIQRPAGDSGLWRPRRRSRGGSTTAPRKAKPFVEINSDFHRQHYALLKTTNFTKTA
jgi:hypothetical protein